MDPISIAFYAVVCGILSLFAPRLGGMIPRLATGAIVGIGAATTLPFIHGIMGY